MWLDVRAGVSRAMAIMRHDGAVVVPDRLAPWVRQSANEQGLTVRTVPIWGGRVRIEIVEVGADVACGRG